MKSAAADAQLEYYAQLKKLRALQEQADNRLDELGEAGDDAGENLKDRVDIAADAVGHALESVRSRFG